MVIENDILNLASGAPTVTQDKHVESPVYGHKKQHTLHTMHTPHTDTLTPQPHAPCTVPPPRQPLAQLSIPRHHNPTMGQPSIHCPPRLQLRACPGGATRGLLGIVIQEDGRPACGLWSLRRETGGDLCSWRESAPAGQRDAFWELWSRRAGARAGREARSGNCGPGQRASGRAGASAGRRGAFWESWSRRAGASE